MNLKRKEKTFLTSYGGVRFSCRPQVIVVFQLVSCQLAQLSVSVGSSQGCFPMHEFQRIRRYFLGPVLRAIRCLLDVVQVFPDIQGLKYIYTDIVQLVLVAQNPVLPDKPNNQASS